MSEIAAIGRKPATPWKIGLGVFLLLAAMSNSTRPAVDGTAEALGALTGISTLLFGGVALIASGLPKNLGNEEFRKARRRLWYKLMGMGFLAMGVTAFAFASGGFITSAVLTMWLYWFVWTWVSWKIADSRTIEKLRVRV